MATLGKFPELGRSPGENSVPLYDSNGDVVGEQYFGAQRFRFFTRVPRPLDRDWVEHLFYADGRSAGVRRVENGKVRYFSPTGDNEVLGPKFQRKRVVMRPGVDSSSEEEEEEEARTLFTGGYSDDSNGTSFTGGPESGGRFDGYSFASSPSLSDQSEGPLSSGGNSGPTFTNGYSDGGSPSFSDGRNSPTYTGGYADVLASSSDGVNQTDAHKLLKRRMDLAAALRGTFANDSEYVRWMKIRLEKLQESF